MMKPYSFFLGALFKFVYDSRFNSIPSLYSFSLSFFVFSFLKTLELLYSFHLKDYSTLVFFAPY